MPISDNAGRLLERFGSACTLRRISVAGGANSWTQGVPTTSYLPQRMKSRHLEVDAVTGAVRDLGSKVLMSPNYVAPNVGDFVAEGELVADGAAPWRRIIHVQTVMVGTAISKHIVTVSK